MLVDESNAVLTGVLCSVGVRGEWSIIDRSLSYSSSPPSYTHPRHHYHPSHHHCRQEHRAKFCIFQLSALVLAVSLREEFKYWLNAKCYEKWRHIS